MRNDSLGRVAGDFIGYVQFFRDAPDTARPSASGLRQQLVTMLDQIAAARVSTSLDPAELETARFALAAWADETILKTSWAGRDQWLNELLQTLLFRTNKGGDEFYDRLSNLPADFNQAREIYFLCLVNGFEGQLLGSDAARHDLTRQLYETLRVAGLAKDSSTERYLAEPAYNLAIEVPRGLGRSLLPMIGIWIVGTAVGCGLLYLALWLLAGGVESPPGDLT